MNPNNPNRATGGKAHFAVAEQVYACMETGNFGQARLLLEEYAEQFPEEAKALRLNIVRDYGRDL